MAMLRINKLFTSMNSWYFKKRICFLKLAHVDDYTGHLLSVVYLHFFQVCCNDTIDCDSDGVRLPCTKMTGFAENWIGSW